MRVDALTRALTILGIAALWCVTLLAARGAAAEPATDKVVAVKAGRLFDGTGDNYREGTLVIIKGQRIEAVGKAGEVSIPAGAEMIDLSDAVVLPGLIDCHTHLGGRADRFDEIYKFKNTPNHSAFAAVLNARKTLERRVYHRPRRRLATVPGGRLARRH